MKKFLSTLKALKSTLNIQKSYKKHSKALKKYSLYLLFSILTGLFYAFNNTVIMNIIN